MRRGGGGKGLFLTGDAVGVWEAGQWSSTGLDWLGWLLPCEQKGTAWAGAEKKSGNVDYYGVTSRGKERVSGTHVPLL